MSKQVNYNENLCSGAAIRDDKGRRISKLFEASHPKMTVGYAKNLIMPDTPTEQEFNFRQSGGGLIEDGVAVIDKVKGNSVVWNQLVKNGNFASTEEWVESGATISISNGEATITQTLPGDYGVGQKVNVVAGNKIMVLVDVKEVTSMYVGVFRSTSYNVGFQSALNTKQIDSVGFVSFFTTIGELGDYKSYIFGFARGGENSFIKVRSVNLINLTQMFGAGNEPSTYEEFLQRKPKVADEYAYNEGTIVNNKVEKVVTTGRNLWDEEGEQGKAIGGNGETIVTTGAFLSSFIEVEPNTAYYGRYPSGVAVRSIWYDKDKNGIGLRGTDCVNNVTTSPSNAKYFRFYMEQSTYNHDICINISDPTINGQYFPYEKHELDLSWIKEIKDAEGVKLFEDGMKSAGTAFDEAAKGRAIKRIGVVDLGSLNFNYDTDINIQNLSSQIPNIKALSSNTIVANILIPTYITKSANDGDIDTSGSKIIYQVGGGYIFFKNSGFEQSDIVGGKIAKLEGQYLYYELAEPIVVEYDEKNLTYPVVTGGTEEAIASEPSTTFRADIGYGIDAVKTILDLKARVEALEGK